MAKDDDLEPLVTQCPNCDTRFRVSESQLQVAQGQVRCGACLTVFDGTATLILDGDPVADDDQDVDVDAVLSEIEAQSDPPTMELDDVEDDLESRLENLEEDAALAALEEQLLAELKSAAPGEETLSALETETWDFPLDADELPEDTGNPVPAAIDGETEAGLAEEGSAGVEMPHEDVANATQPAELDTLDLDDDPLTQAPRNPEPEKSLLQRAQEKARSEQARLPDISPEAAYEIPPELFEDEPRRRSTLTWVVLLIALLALPAQILWYQFDTWGKDERFRPIYAMACDVLDCALPVRRDVGKIIARNSVLREHPEVADALVYDAILVNQADYDQPFPLVELTLTSVRGHLVASRRFEPSEYLSGEGETLDDMPMLTPIHIALEIKDPGEAPLNFRVRFLPYQTRG